MVCLLVITCGKSPSSNCLSIKILIPPSNTLISGYLKTTFSALYHTIHAHNQSTALHQSHLYTIPYNQVHYTTLSFISYHTTKCITPLSFIPYHTTKCITPLSALYHTIQPKCIAPLSALYHTIQTKCITPLSALYHAIQPKYIAPLSALYHTIQPSALHHSQLYTIPYNQLYCTTLSFIPYHTTKRITPLSFIPYHTTKCIAPLLALYHTIPYNKVYYTTNYNFI